MFQTEFTEGEKRCHRKKKQNVTHSNAFQFIDYTENYNWYNAAKQHFLFFSP